jgi:hypothetical protein
MGETLNLDEVMRKITRVAANGSMLREFVDHVERLPRMSRDEVAAILRRSDALGDCGPEPEDIDAEAARVADFMSGHRALHLLRQMRDGTCSDPEAAKAEILGWLQEEQGRDAAARRAAIGLAVRTMTDLGEHHVIVQMDGVTMDPTTR